MRSPAAIAMLALGGGCNALLGVHDFGGTSPGDDAAVDGAAGDDGPGDGPGDAPAVTCDPKKPFGAPALITELDDTTHSVFITDVDATGTILYLASDRADGIHLTLFSATRANPTDPWDVPVPASAPTTVWAAVSQDGLTAIRAEGADLFVAQRSKTGELFQTGAEAAINTAGIEDTPRLTRDGTSVYFATDRGGMRRDLYIAKFDGTTLESAAELEGGGIKTALNESAPALTGDELTLYFSRGDQNNKNRAILGVTRDSTSELFNNPMPEQTLNMAGENIVGAVSPDGCTLYLTNIAVGSSRARPYVAVKPP